MAKQQQPAKHPLKSKAMIGAYLTIAAGFLQYFGVIGPNQRVDITIDDLNAPPANKQEKDVVGLGLVGAGILAAKGRRDANRPIGKLLGDL